MLGVFVLVQLVGYAGPRGMGFNWFEGVVYMEKTSKSATNSRSIMLSRSCAVEEILYCG